MLFSRACPLFDTGLTIGMRLLYTSVTWSYITNTFAVPCAVLVPFIALVFGVYPLVLNRDFALAATLYFSASTLVTSYCTNRKHIKPLWFCIVSCHLLWFTFTKALVNVLFRKITKKKVVFKSTKKKGEDDGRGAKASRKWCRPPANVGDMEGTLDAWILVVSFSFSFITAVVGLFQIIDKPFTAQGDFKFYLMLSVFWAVYNMIPPSLFIFYCYQKGHLFEDFCSFCLTLSYLVAMAGILCTWLVPDDYNMSQVRGARRAAVLEQCMGAGAAEGAKAGPGWPLWGPQRGPRAWRPVQTAACAHSSPANVSVRSLLPTPPPPGAQREPAVLRGAALRQGAPHQQHALARQLWAVGLCPAA